MVEVAQHFLFFVDRVFHAYLQLAHESTLIECKVDQEVSVARVQSILDSDNPNAGVFLQIFDHFFDVTYPAGTSGSQQI